MLLLSSELKLGDELALLGRSVEQLLPDVGYVLKLGTSPKCPQSVTFSSLAQKDRKGRERTLTGLTVSALSTLIWPALMYSVSLATISPNCDEEELFGSVYLHECHTRRVRSRTWGT